MTAKSALRGGLDDIPNDGVGEPAVEKIIIDVGALGRLDLSARGAEANRLYFKDVSTEYEVQQ
jgi:hypothetical protein